MLTEEQREALRKELNRPYTPEELILHLTDRPLKSICEKMHAHNLALAQCALDWTAHLNHKTTEPAVKIWRALRPGHNPANEACTTLEELIEISVGYGFGKLPDIDILFYASQSTSTLIDLLDQLHHTAHIDTMEANANDFFALLTYRGPKKMSASTFEQRLTKLKDDFVKACAENATELHTYIFNLREQGKESNSPKSDVHQAVAKAQAKIVKAVENEAKKTRRTIKTTANKSVKEIRTNSQSDYDKRGPSTKVRERQFLAVVDRMREFGAHKTMLPPALMNKRPSKWIRQACRDIWSEIPGGYHKLSSLYIYCHRNIEKILSLSGL